ncbi:MAG: helix-turn-helix transcriptional regulator [Candidatus Binataceae bacterium]
MKQETLGEVLRRRRQALALSQRDLAREVGVKGSHVAYLENGRRRPSFSLLKRIADTLGLDKQQLFVLAYPEAIALISPGNAGDAERATTHPPDVWRQFVENRALLKRHRVSPSEIEILKRVNMHWRLTSPLHLLLVLNVVRQAVQGVDVEMPAALPPASRPRRRPRSAPAGQS